MKRRFFFTLCLLSALAAPAAHARQEPKPLRISYVRAPFNLQLMVMNHDDVVCKPSLIMFIGFMHSLYEFSISYAY